VVLLGGRGFCWGLVCSGALVVFFWGGGGGVVGGGLIFGGLGFFWCLYGVLGFFFGGGRCTNFPPGGFCGPLVLVFGLGGGWGVPGFWGGLGALSI